MGTSVAAPNPFLLTRRGNAAHHHIEGSKHGASHSNIHRALKDRPMAA